MFFKKVNRQTPNNKHAGFTFKRITKHWLKETIETHVTMASLHLQVNTFSFTVSVLHPELYFMSYLMSFKSDHDLNLASSSILIYRTVKTLSVHR